MDTNLFLLSWTPVVLLTVLAVFLRRSALELSIYGVLFALVLALIGLGMFNFAGYLALNAYMSPALAALSMSLINVVGASIMGSLGRKAGPSDNEERMAREMREMAYKEVSQDVEEVKGRLESMASEVGAIRENVARATSGVRFMLGILTKGAK